MTTRAAAVQGLFYESDGERLRQSVMDFLRLSPPVDNNMPKVLIVPHAGYIYSGRIAAAAYRSVQARARNIRRVVVLGPAHRVYLRGMALPTVDTFSTPLGEVPLDRESLQAVSRLPGTEFCDEAHRQEHSIEVQLPFLQSIITNFSLVPIVVGDCTARAVGTVIDALWGGPETLIVVSTDLSHFHRYEHARQIDSRTCARLLARDNSLAGEDACGARVLNGLMCSDKCAPLAVKLLDSCNSGDTAGDKDRVVGYGAFILY